MRIAWLVVAALLAACRDGIELEILADGTTTRVEVFVATHAAAPDSTLAQIPAIGPENPDPEAPLVAGTLFPRDLAPDGSIEPPFLATVDGEGRARLELRADGEHTSVAALIAVGYDASGTITSAAVLHDVDVSDAPVRVIMELAPVSHALVDGLPAAAQVWGAADGGAGCVGVTDADGVTEFIVTEADPDCDGFTRGPSDAPVAGEVECDAVDHHGAVASSDGALRVVGATCGTYATTCTDGVGEEPGEREVCVPDRVCELTCAAGGVDACLGTLTDPSGFAHLTCSIPISIDAITGDRRLCNDDFADTSNLANLFTGGVTCTEVAFARLLTPSTFGQDLTISTAAGGGEVVTARAEIDSNAAGCAFTLFPSAFVFATTPDPPRQHVRLRASNGQELRLPIKFVQRGCNLPEQGIACKYERSSVGSTSTADGIEVCAQQP